MTFPLPFFCPSTAIAIPASIVYNGNVNSQANNTNYTTQFTAVPIGTATADRYCVFSISAGVVSSQTLSSVTVNGNSPTILQSVYDTSGTKADVDLIGISISSGTTANLQISWSSGVNRCSVLSYSLYNLQSTTPTSYSVKGASGNPYTISGITYPAGSVALAVAASYDGGTARLNTWTGLTEDYDANIENGCVVTGASNSFPSYLAAQTVTIQPSVSSVDTFACSMHVFR